MGGFDPASLFTKYNAIGRYGVVAETGGTVDSTLETYLDLSGQDMHFTQSSPENQPTLKLDGSGRKYLEFDGSNDLMAVNLGAAPTGDFTAILIGALRAIPATAITYGRRSGTIGGWFLGATNSPNVVRTFIYPNTGTAKIVDLAYTPTNIYRQALRRSGNVNATFLNGEKEDEYTHAMGASSTALTLGAFNSSAQQAQLNCYAEFFIEVALTDAEIIAVKANLMRRAGF